MDIRLIQRQLNKLINTKLEVDGELGPKTLRAIKDFQKSKGLEVDGKVGPKTLLALFPQEEPEQRSTNLSIRAMEIALSKDGVREATGKNDGPEVEMFLKSTGLPKGYPWCQSFLYWCYEQASKELGVPNPMYRTAGVLVHWANTKGLKTNKPQVGDIFAMSFGGGAGHAGIVTGISGSSIKTIEANTNAQGSREGNQVAQRIRKMSSILGFIRY